MGLLAINVRHGLFGALGETRSDSCSIYTHFSFVYRHTVVRNSVLASPSFRCMPQVEAVMLITAFGNYRMHSIMRGHLHSRVIWNF